MFNAIISSSGARSVASRSNLRRGETRMKTELLAAGLVAGLALASSETFAAGPMLAPGALATTSAGSAASIVEQAVVVVRRRAVVRRPVVRRRVVR
jgi:hypothetical protein